MHWFFCLAFRAQNKTVESVDMTVWFVHICQTFAESSQFCKCKILDLYFISDRENVDWKNVRYSLLVLLHSTPLFHHHSIFILCYLFYVHHHEKSSNHFIPVIVIVLFIISSPHYALDHVYYAQVVYLVSRVVARSMIIYLMLPDKKGGRSVLTQHLSTGLHTYVCM